ncbi:MAG: cytochrome c peroxidase [Pseudomonadota bacterium]
MTLDTGVARIPVGKLQTWNLILEDAQGTPVRDAHVVVGGGMRAHGHGLPTQPEVSTSMRAGHYQLEGLQFSMTGEWTLALSIDSATGRDRILFEFRLENPSRDIRLSEMAIDSQWQPPASPSNRVANDPNAAALGNRLFIDPLLSGDGTLSCASCHDPGLFFTDGAKLGQGSGRAMRNTPSLIGASAQSWFYWDGRRDSLWAQALLPFEAVEEMNASRLAVVRHVLTDPEYRREYEAVFGPPPDIPFDTLPDRAGPIGDTASKAAWATLDRREQSLINAVFANLGKSIAAYERTLPAPDSPFDRYVAGRATSHHSAHHGQRETTLSASALRGLELFLNEERTHCLRCHNGDWFSNQGFHNIGTGNFFGDRLDFGRVYGLQAAIRDEFNCLGPFSDADPDECAGHRFLSTHSHVPLEGAFKVPTLRNLTHTAPYMHDGRFSTLREVIEYYRNPPEGGPPHELKPLDISDDEADDLVAFLESLSGDLAQP